MPGLQEEYTRIHRRLVAERRQLEEKYFKRFMPLLMQRTEIVNKRLDPSDIDIKAEGAWAADGGRGITRALTFGHPQIHPACQSNCRPHQLRTKTKPILLMTTSQALVASRGSGCRP